MNNFFINYYKKNNRLIANIPFKYVLQHKIIIPNEQRIDENELTYLYNIHISDNGPSKKHN